MLVLFQTNDPAHPEKPARDRLINDIHIVDVEPIYPDQRVNGEPIYIAEASLITLSDKRKIRVPHPPRAVLRAFKTGAIEGSS